MIIDLDIWSLNRKSFYLSPGCPGLMQTYFASYKKVYGPLCCWKKKVCVPSNYHFEKRQCPISSVYGRKIIFFVRSNSSFYDISQFTCLSEIIRVFLKSQSLKRSSKWNGFVMNRIFNTSLHTNGSQHLFYSQ